MEGCTTVAADRSNILNVMPVGMEQKFRDCPAMGGGRREGGLASPPRAPHASGIGGGMPARGVATKSKPLHIGGRFHQDRAPGNGWGSIQVGPDGEGKTQTDNKAVGRYRMVGGSRKRIPSRWMGFAAAPPAAQINTVTDSSLRAITALHSIHAVTVFTF